MGWLDKRVEKRAQELAAQAGRYSGGMQRFDLSGLLANRVDGNEELTRLRPAPETALSASSVAARCINLLVQTAASRPLYVTTETGEAVDHYLEKLWNKAPNPSQSAMLFRTSVWLRLYTTGQAFIILDRGKSRVADPTSAVVHYGEVRVVLTDPTPTAPHGTVLAYKVAVGDEMVTLAPTEVLWLRFPDASDPWKASAPITAALDAIGLSKAARGWQAGQLSNGANPTGIVYIGQPASDEDYDFAREEIEAALTGPSSAGRIATVGGPVAPQFIRTSFSASEVGYLDTLNAAGEDIALALGVPLDLVGGQRTYSNVEASERLLWTGAVQPRLDVVASEIDRQLLADTNLTADFDTSDVAALREGQDGIVNRTVAAANADLLTIDEAREALGYDPLPDGAGAILLSQMKATLAPTVAVVNQARDLSTDVDTETRAITDEAPATDTPAIQVRGIDPETSQRSLDTLEASMTRAVERLAAAQKRDALKRLSRGKRDALAPDVHSVFDPELWAERAYEYLLPAIAAAMDGGAAGTAAALEVTLSVDALVAQAADARAAVLADQVNRTTRKVLEDKLAAAATTDGLTVKQFADALENTFSDLSTWRAETIARTEMVAGYNYGSRAAATASGVARTRIWTAALDGRTRDSHVALNGYRTTGMEDPYPNGLMFPGDPSGAGHETVNCRCVEQFTTELDN